MKKVGVLALQGDFEAHGRALARAGAEPPPDLESFSGLELHGPVMRAEQWECHGWRAAVSPAACETAALH